MKLYRNKYLIGVYAPVSEGETLVALCANADEFAATMAINRRNADQILSLLFRKQSRYLRFNGQICTVEFILEAEEC